MLRRAFLLAVLTSGLLPAGGARAAAPVPGWSGGAPRDAAVNDRGQGVVVFQRGGQVHIAQVDARGRVRRSDPVTSARQRDVVDDPLVRIAPGGEVVAEWGSYERDASRGGVGGFVRVPRVLRFRWGRRPPPSEAVVSGDVDTRFPQLAQRADGTAAVLFTQSRPADEDDAERVAIVPPRGRIVVTTLERRGSFDAGPLNPVGIGVDGAGRFHAAWDAGFSSPSSVHVAVSDPRTNAFAAGFAALPEDRRLSGPGDLLVAGDGTEVVVWQRHARGGDLELRAAARRPDGVLGPPAVVAPLGRYGSETAQAIDGDGRAWVGWPSGRTVWWARRDADGTVTPRRAATRSGNVAGGDTVAVGAPAKASGAILAFDAVAGRRGEVVALALPGARTVARLRGCAAPGVAVSPRGRMLLTAFCGDRQRGVVALPARR